MTALVLAPAALSLLVLGAHFLRAGRMELVLLCLALVALLFVRRRWAGIAIQLALALGALEWLRATLVLTGERISVGRPWIRMAVILGAVAAVCAVAALLLATRRARRWFRAASAAAAAEPAA